MGEFMVIRKSRYFKDRFETDTPEKRSKASGPCLRVALFQAGYDTDLPAWISSEHLPEICAELGLNLLTDKGGEVSLLDGEPYIIGYETGRDPKQPIGHYVFTIQISEIFKHIDQKDIFAIIEIPQGEIIKV